MRAFIARPVREGRWEIFNDHGYYRGDIRLIESERYRLTGPERWGFAYFETFEDAAQEAVR